MAIEVPTPNYDDPKEVWAFYGLAAYSANLIEQSLINLGVVLQLPSVNVLTRDTFEKIFYEFDKKTLGQLLEAARKTTIIPENLDELLQKVLDKRNYLVHSFFHYHSEDAISQSGRRSMVDELAELIDLFRTVDPKLEEIYLPLWENHGVDEAFMRDEWEKTQARIRERDVS